MCLLLMFLMPIVTYTVVKLSNSTPKQIDLTSVFVTTAAYCVSMLLLTSVCKQAPAQYKQCKCLLLIGVSINWHLH